MPAEYPLRDRPATRRAGRDSGFRSDRRPCGRVRQETRRNEDIGARGDSIGSGHVFLSSRTLRSRQPIEIRCPPEVERRRQICLLNRPECNNFRQEPGNIRNDAVARPRLSQPLVDNGFSTMNKTNPAQRLRHELRRASIAGAMDPSARPHAEYNRLPYWIDLAKTLERGRFDGLFLADVLGVYDVFGGSPDAALRNATQTPVNDPLLLISGDGRRNRKSRFRGDIQPVLRTALSHSPGGCRRSIISPRGGSAGTW